MGERKKKGIKNIIYGLLGQALSIGFAVILPRLIILQYGSETNGMVGSITQIFAYVALLEAGVGGATLQALYKPIADSDGKKISAIMSATNVFYRKTGIIYFLAVVALAVFYPLIISSELPYLTIFGTVIFNGLGGVVNYLFQGKYRILLQAEGKNYILTNAATFVNIFSNFVKIGMLWLNASIVVLQLSFFIINILQTAFYIIYIKKHYSWLKTNAEPDFDAISKKNSVMVHQVSSLIFGNTDSIVLSLFNGLKSVSVYTTISGLITHINSIINTFSNGLVFALGQSFQKDKKQFEKYYNMYEVFYYSLSTFCLIMIFVFLNPFLKLYTAGITDIEYVDAYLPILFVAVYMLSWFRVPSVQVIYNCAGHYRETIKQSIIESVLNITVSVISVIWLGLYGVLIGTIVALLYRTNEMVVYCSKKILSRSVWISYKRLLINFGWMIIASALGSILLPKIDGWLEIFVYAFLYSVILAVLQGAIAFIFERRTVKDIFKTVLKRR